GSSGDAQGRGRARALGPDVPGGASWVHGAGQRCGGDADVRSDGDVGGASGGGAPGGGPGGGRVAVGQRVERRRERVEPGAAAGEPGVRHLHVGFDGYAQRGDGHARIRGEPAVVDAAGAGDEPGRCAAGGDDAVVRYRRPGAGTAAVGGGAAGGGDARAGARRRGAVRAHRAAWGDDDAGHAGDVAAYGVGGVRGPRGPDDVVRRRGAASGARRGALARQWRAVERVWPHGDDHLVASQPRAVERGDSDRAGDREYAGVRVGWSAGAVARGGGGRALRRWRGRGTGLSGSLGTDERALRAGPVQRRAWRAAVPDGRPRSLAGRWDAGVPRSQRSPGEDPRISDRARRDRIAVVDTGRRRRGRGGSLGGRAG